MTRVRHLRARALASVRLPPARLWTVRELIGFRTTDAIMRGMDLDSRDRGDSLDDALKDLDSLMAKAKDMVRSGPAVGAKATAR